MVPAIAEHEPELKIRKKHFVELVKLVSLQPEHLDPFLPVMVHQSLVSSGVHASIEKVTKKVKERIICTEFIEQFFEPFAQTFTHEEMLQLISFYKTEAMQKYIKHSMKLHHPLYEAYRKVVDEVTQEYAKRED